MNYKIVQDKKEFDIDLNNYHVGAETFYIKIKTNKRV